MNSLLCRGLVLLTFSLAPPILLQAGSATWASNPTSGDWNMGANWRPHTVPNSETDIATFRQSKVTDVSVLFAEVDSVIFKADASPYTFTVYNPMDVAYLIFWGAGVINKSPNEQTFVFPSNFLYGVNVEFRNTATAGDRVTYYASNGGNGIFFGESSNAGSANFIVNSFMDFYGDGTQTPSAANATILNDPGYTTFSFGGSAGNAVITNQHGGWTDFGLGGRAGNATIINEGTVGTNGWQSHTSLGGSADTATIINNPATVQGGEGGYTFYISPDVAQSPTIINNGSSFLNADTAGRTFVTGNGDSAGNATLIAHGGINGGAGGAIFFANDTDGGMARVQLDGNGFLDISTRKPPGLNIGSVEGDGEIFLGANNLGIGGNNLSTQFSGHIQDGGTYNRTGGAITKIGSGTLTLTGANTYTGTTTVSAGTLQVSNGIGSGTGTGPVNVNVGTLGGKGIIAGTITVGTGAGSGAFLAPAAGMNAQATLTIQSSLTFNSDAIYTYTFSATHNRVRTDKVVANGVTINSGATIALSGQIRGPLTQGLVLTVISNTSANPISGTFSNLPDGEIVTISGNNFQASYEGGDGNDLTLTVVP
jgi:autotransporter-associated beta strand protein